MIKYLFRVLILLAIPAGGIFAQESTTSEDTLLLPILTAGEAITGEIVDSVSSQLYAFNATAGDVVTIEMVADVPDLDPFLILLDATGSVIAENDDRATDSRDAAITDVELPADGTYIVFASTFQNLDEFLDLAPDNPLPYTLTATGFTSPEDAEIALDTERIAPGDTLTGESDAETPVTYVLFEAESEQPVDIFMRQSEQIDPVLHIFSLEGERIAFDDDDDESETFTLDSAVRGLDVAEDGVYLIIATDTFFYNAGKDDVSLIFEGGSFELEMQPAS
jgi:hypothetical protein